MKSRSFAEKRNRNGIFFILPGFIGIAIFSLIPFADVIRRSFCTAVGGRFVGLSNYSGVIKNSAFQTAATNTLKFTLICIPLLIVLSLLFSVMLFSLKRFSTYLKTSYLLPLAVPVSSAAMLWKILFCDEGIVNMLITQNGGQPENWIKGGSAFFIVALSYLWKNMGYNMILWLAGMAGISSSVLEAAELDNCTGIKKLIYIILPQLKGTALTVIILSIVNSFKVFREIYLVAGDYPDQNIYMLQNLFNNWFVSLDIQKMSAGAVMLAAVVTTAIVIIMKCFEKDGAE